jgi:hypothetical protein
MKTIEDMLSELEDAINLENTDYTERLEDFIYLMNSKIYTEAEDSIQNLFEQMLTEEYNYFKANFKIEEEDRSYRIKTLVYVGE